MNSNHIANQTQTHTHIHILDLHDKEPNKQQLIQVGIN